MKEFVQLREAWFDHVLAFDPSSDGQRIEGCKAADINKEMKVKFDQQTIGIILGRQYEVAPVSASDMDER